VSRQTGPAAPDDQEVEYPMPTRRPRSRARSWLPVTALSAAVILLIVLVATSGGKSAGPAATQVGALPTFGVTPTSISLGIAEGDPASAAVVGAQPQDIPSVAESERMYLAGLGGHRTINGRTVHVHLAIYEITDQTDPVRQCQKLIGNDDVFAVLADQFIGGGTGCVAQHERPMLAQYTDDDTPYTSFPGLSYQIVPRLPTDARALVTRLAALGLLKGRRIGVLGSALGGLKSSTQNVLIPDLERHGVTPVATYYLSGDIGVIAGQIPVAVNAMRAAHVNELITMDAGPDVSQFANRAVQIGYHPQYVLSDVGDASTFGFLYPPAMKGAVAFTAYREGPSSTAVVQTAAEKSCLSHYEALGGKPLTPNSVLYDELMRSCDLMSVFVKAATAAGRHLTVQSFTSAMQHLGRLQLASVGPASLTPGKFDAADDLQEDRFSGSCTCFAPVGAFRSYR
jgi:hypothetical protein